ncbi:MAG: efflux RND transporter periplasmic adaptor subunit [Proteobacteria bacterium]|nr:efflux RND transporter periplasmic adaptor subunit [Pseudomonadota bacterium]
MKPYMEINDNNFRLFDITRLILIGLIIFLVVFISSCSKEKAAIDKEPVVRPVKILTLTDICEISTRKFPGKVRASQRVDLAFQVPGLLIKLSVKEGQYVGKGELLAQINPKDFQINLKQAQGQLAMARASVERAQSDYERILRIKKEDSGATSQAMVDQRRAALDIANAEITSLEAAVEGAKDKLSYTYMSAPFAGVIAKRYVNNFGEVQAKQPIVSLQDISYVEILINVPENVVANIKEKNSSTFAEFTADPGKFYKLDYKEIGTEADPMTLTYQVVLMMKSPKGINIFPGMTANVLAKAELGECDSQTYVIPAICVFADEAGNSNVWVVDPGKMTVHKRKVATGNLTGEDSIQILKGLSYGEKIATSGVSMLREGMKVRDLDELEAYK